MTFPGEKRTETTPPKIAALEHQPTREQVIKLPDVTVLTERTDLFTPTDIALMKVSLSMLRSKDTGESTYRRHIESLTERLIPALLDANTKETTITTTLGRQTKGFELGSRVALIGINRASLSMMLAMRRFLSEETPIGYIFVGTDRATLEGDLKGFNLPPEVTGRDVILLHPANGAGGSITCARRVIEKEYGQTFKSFRVGNIFSSPLGIVEVKRANPDTKICTVSLDDRLIKPGEIKDEYVGFIEPGAGDVGIRQFGVGRSNTFLSREETLKTEFGVELIDNSRRDLDVKTEGGKRVFRQSTKNGYRESGSYF